jgi:rod shape-determining protein MreD
MMYYVLLPFMAVVLVVLQSKLAEILFSGLLTLEMSLIVVIYAGFRLDLWKGAALSLVVGLAMDCLSGTVLGLFSLLYVCIFLFAWFASSQIDSERLYLIAGFSLICSIAESLALVLLYRFVFEFDMIDKILPVLAPQALLVAVLSVCFFYAMRRVERLLTYG